MDGMTNPWRRNTTRAYAKRSVTDAIDLTARNNTPAKRRRRTTTPEDLPIENLALTGYMAERMVGGGETQSARNVNMVMLTGPHGPFPMYIDELDTLRGTLHIRAILNATRIYELYTTRGELQGVDLRSPPGVVTRDDMRGNLVLRYETKDVYLRAINIKIGGMYVPPAEDSVTITAV